MDENQGQDQTTNQVKDPSQEVTTTAPTEAQTSQAPGSVEGVNPAESQPIEPPQQPEVQPNDANTEGGGSKKTKWIIILLALILIVVVALFLTTRGGNEEKATDVNVNVTIQPKPTKEPTVTLAPSPTSELKLTPTVEPTEEPEPTEELIPSPTIEE